LISIAFVIVVGFVVGLASVGLRVDQGIVAS